MLIAIAIVIATLILLYQAYGFGLAKGTVIQNGLTFFSSQPHPAKIYVNGALKTSTNTRLVLPAGVYQIKLSRDGYRDWQRKIELNGGSVQHFDYPFLFPKVLTTKTIHPYSSAPGLMTQSPDRRWLFIEQPGSMTNFDIYDLKNPAKPAVAISLPGALLTKAINPTGEAWQLEEWADDNQHLLLQHSFDGKTEFILIDRTNPAQSLNLNNSLSFSPSKLTLKDRKYDQYYIYDAASASLQAASLKSTARTTLLQRVIAYKTYSDDTILYVTDSDSSDNSQVEAKIAVGNQISTIHSLPLSAAYLIDLTKYTGTMYVAIGSTNSSKVYIYKDPAGQLNKQPKHVATPTQVLHVDQPNYLSFSASAQFIVTENGTSLGVYDVENKIVHKYNAKSGLDAPQIHASWMDGNRLHYVSNGKLNVFDYDGTNGQSLASADSRYLPAFAPDYKGLYTLVPNATNGQFEFTETFLLKADDR